MTVIRGPRVVALMNGGKSKGASMPRSPGDNADSRPGAQWETPRVCEKLHKARHVLVFVRWSKTEKRLGCGSLATVGAGRNRFIRECEPQVVVCRDNSAMVVEREVLRMGTELLAVLLLTEGSLFMLRFKTQGEQLSTNLTCCLCGSSINTEEYE